MVMLVYSRWQSLQKRFNSEESGEKKEKSEKPMVKCAQCGIYLPQKEAIADDEPETHYFCSKEHQQAYLENKDK